MNVPAPTLQINVVIYCFFCFSDMTRHPSTDSTPSDSGSSPSDSGSSPSPSTPQKLLPVCSSPFGPRLFHVTPSSSGTPRPQPEGSDHRNNNKTTRLSGKLGGHGPCGRYVPVKMERIKVYIMCGFICNLTADAFQWYMHMNFKMYIQCIIARS